MNTHYGFWFHLRDSGNHSFSCSVELELESSLLQNDLEAFHHRVRQAFSACRKAVQEELTRRQIVTLEVPRAGCQNTRSTDGYHGNGQLPGLTNPATRKQVEYAQQLAGQIGSGKCDLEAIAQRMFNKSVSELSSADASGLIRVLKDIKAGKLEVDLVMDVASQ